MLGEHQDFVDEVGLVLLEFRLDFTLNIRGKGGPFL